MGYSHIVIPENSPLQNRWIRIYTVLQVKQDNSGT